MSFASAHARGWYTGGMELVSEPALQAVIFWWMHDLPDVPFTVTRFGEEVSSGTVTWEEVVDAEARPLRDRMRTPRLDL